jgi:hypothetical protein
LHTLHFLLKDKRHRSLSITKVENILYLNFNF